MFTRSWLRMTWRTAVSRLSHNIARPWFCCGSAVTWRGVACDALVIKPKIILRWSSAKLPGGASASPPSFSRASVTERETHFLSQPLLIRVELFAAPAEFRLDELPEHLNTRTPELLNSPNSPN